MEVWCPFVKEASEEGVVFDELWEKPDERSNQVVWLGVFIVKSGCCSGKRWLEMAERVGFEPTDPGGDHLISSQARSASSGTSPKICWFSNSRCA